MHKRLFVILFTLIVSPSFAQIDLDYALDDGRLSQKSNVFSLSVDDALRGDLGIYYTREFRSMDLSFGYTHRMYEPLKADFYFLDNYPRLERMDMKDYQQFSFAYDQIIQSIENYGFSFRIHYSRFHYQKNMLSYESLAVNSGFLFKPVMNNAFYFNAFIGLGAVLYESELSKTDLGAYMALECRMGFKFNLSKR